MNKRNICGPTSRTLVRNGTLFDRPSLEPLRPHTIMNNNNNNDNNNSNNTKHHNNTNTDKY